MVIVVLVWQLIESYLIKIVLDIELDIIDCNMNYKFGDFFGIVCLNFKDEVDELILRLDLSEKVDILFFIQLILFLSKKVVCVLNYIFEYFIIKYILLICLEIRSVLSKVFVRVMVEYIFDL